MNKTNVKPPVNWREYKTDKLVIKNARLFDPAIRLDKIADLMIIDGKIDKIGRAPEKWTGESIDASGWLVTPGLFDMHVHFREPGYEHKETIASGCRAAVAGGFTGVAPMPNTNPAIDNPGLVEFVRDQAFGYPVEVHPIPAITHGRKGECLSEMAELVESGSTAFSDDGSPLDSAEIMRRALEYTKMFDAVIIEHCQDNSLTADGIMHEGEVSTRLGLPGWPAIGEEIAIERNIRLAEYTGGHLHIAHISTAGSLELVRAARKRGVNITAEVAPQHLTLDCEILASFNSDYKVNPPLRTREDCNALIEGLADGSIDAIATDHAPHAPDEKEVELLIAPFGMIGLETAVGVLMTKLVNEKKISLERMIDALTAAPRRILHLPAVSIEKGKPANLTMLNPERTWKVDREKFLSKSKNTPFNGWELKGKAVGVVNNGLAWICEG